MYLDTDENIERIRDIMVEWNCDNSLTEICDILGMTYAHVLNPENDFEQDFKSWREMRKTIIKFQNQPELYINNASQDKTKKSKTTSKTNKTTTNKKVASSKAAKKDNTKTDVP